MANGAFEDDRDLQVVGAIEPFENFFHREFPRMDAVAYAMLEPEISWAGSDPIQ